MSKKYKKYSAKLKAEVAFSVLKGTKSDLELCSEYKIPKTNLYEWKQKLLEGAESLFLPESQRDKKNKELEGYIERLQKLIGEMTIENNFLKKKLQN